ncbi:MAG TPA: alpha/beta hydrolase family protein [Pyrinomonadaceae bacterium]|nr:alpha/beta hydrolase family protein [Pyrinomonadaceae bacterium]
MMRHARLLVVLLFLLVPFTARGQTTAPAAKAEAVKSSVETVQFESKMVGAKLPYSVVLPPEYSSTEARAKSFPVLYLLHGLTGHYTDWLSKSKLADHAARHHVIIVTPDGNNGWYTDSNVAPTDKYETYIIKELIPDVEKRFRAITARQGRAIAGLSMGGYGALKFGLKYPEMFFFAASLSGALAATSINPDDPQTAAWVKPSIERAYGKIDNPVRPANDIFKIVRELPAERVASLPYLYIDCGTEDFLIGSNMRMAALLVERKIPHEYRQLPGKHDWPYWDRQVQEVLRIMEQRMSPAFAVKAAGASDSK